jgi:hypothetical protein
MQSSEYVQNHNTKKINVCAIIQLFSLKLVFFISVVYLYPA